MAPSDSLIYIGEWLPWDFYVSSPVIIIFRPNQFSLPKMASFSSSVVDRRRSRVAAGPSVRLGLWDRPKSRRWQKNLHVLFVDQSSIMHSSPPPHKLLIDIEKLCLYVFMCCATKNRNKLFAILQFIYNFAIHLQFYNFQLHSATEQMPALV
jgi:hypothetical protein